MHGQVSFIRAAAIVANQFFAAELTGLAMARTVENVAAPTLVSTMAQVAGAVGRLRRFARVCDNANGLSQIWYMTLRPLAHRD